jgi:hypothetical protein
MVTVIYSRGVLKYVTTVYKPYFTYVFYIILIGTGIYFICAPGHIGTPYDQTFQYLYAGIYCMRGVKPRPACLMWRGIKIWVSF